jgi:RNA polymerase sigma-70 factor (ECF subfamily)
VSASRSDPGGAVERFTRARPRLLGLAYRMIGVRADAEDVVQEAWLRWQAADMAAIERPDAWLTTVTTRLALDRLKAQRRRREDYVGPWLPEPVVLAPGPEETAELAETLTFGFLAVLDLLGPVERAVFLLVDVFGVPYPDVATAVDKTEVACRQLASRARRRVREGHPRAPTGPERRLVDELITAVTAGDVEATLASLAPDVVLVSDGGPNRRAARRPVVGAERVARLLINLTDRAFGRARATPIAVNGDPGLVVSVDGTLDMVIAFEVEDDRVAALWIVRNPDKLEHVMSPAVMA